ncbi:amino acid permease [bacterium]|jgi:amino acid transporter/mannitol/fructose-specific phosphotransferase system IIA component (Ntr-type)|nr:amino acid permease [bacterium]
MSVKLKKEISLLDIFCVATGAMISSGLFILPGLAFAIAGPAVILSYIIAGLLCIPTLLSMAELVTAMPRAGGDYFYIMRGFGPLMGTLAGYSSWFSLSLKGAFALIGMGAYLSIITNLPIETVALVCCVLFVILNIMGIKEAGKAQVMFVIGLLAILFYYILAGLGSVDMLKITPFFSRGISPVFAAASFVFISYGGLTKVAALAEEARNPGRNLPLGMILSLSFTAVIYTLVIFVTVGIMNPVSLEGTLTPISDGAAVLGGKPLQILISIAAFLAFISTANSAIMTASRYPLSMSRDKLVSPVLQKVSKKFNTPYMAIIITGLFMVAVITILKVELLVKVASSILILLYIFANFTVIMFRESKIQSYRPKFRSPFYPYLQVAGILGCGFLLIEMGSFVVFLTLIFLFFGFMWYRLYGQKRTSRDFALIYALERIISRDIDLGSDNLLTELKDVVMQRDAIVEDRFHKMMEASPVMDIKEKTLGYLDFFKSVSDVLSPSIGLGSGELFDKFIQREQVCCTVIKKGMAIPHIVVAGEKIFSAVIARSKKGIIFPNDELVHALFIFVGSKDERNFHLRSLAAIAEITQNPDFDKKWMEARDEKELKNLILLADRRRDASQ